MLDLRGLVCDEQWRDYHYPCRLSVSDYGAGRSDFYDRFGVEGRFTMTEFWVGVLVAFVVGAGAGLVAVWLVAAVVWLVGAYLANKGGMKRKGGK